MSTREPDEYERWLGGEAVAGLALLHNSVVEFAAVDGTKKEGWVVSATIRPERTIYTVEACDGSGDFELPESAIRKLT